MTDVALVPSATYWRATREARYALIFAVPLFIFYQLLVAMQPVGPAGSWRNGADVLLQQIFIALAGSRGPLLFLITLNVAGAWLIVHDIRRHPGPLRPRYFWLMFLETAVLAFVVGIAVGTLTTQIVRPPTGLAITAAVPLGASLSTRMMLAIGAGLYEELLFRVLIVGALALLARNAFKWKPTVAGAVAAGVGALLFAAFHYVGPGGDKLELYSFVYRTVGGLFFSALFLLRGFGITAWTHALYDILVMVVQA
jgi:hypothetical protein